MPPKRGAMAQAIRSAFTEDASVAVVETWFEKTIPALEQLVERSRTARAEVRAKSNAAAAGELKAPKPVLAVVQSYQDEAREVFVQVEKVRTVIAVRIPELKMEDNLGVEVQLAVLKMLDGIQGRLTGKGGDKEGGSSVASMFAPEEYLKARADVEDKLVVKPDDKEATPLPTARSRAAHLQQVDADALLKVELASIQLASSLRSFINVYALNWKKLIEPRTSGNDRMVS